MTKPITTIQFNTGRKYTAEGQIITATLYSDGVVTFMDHSRMIDGQFKNEKTELLTGDNYDPALPRFAAELRAEVMGAYDRNTYQISRRASHDGMVDGGRNTREGYELIAKLRALPTPEKFAAHGLEGLVSLWADFCGSMGFERVEALEVLTQIVGTKRGAVWDDVREWVEAFIKVWTETVEGPTEEAKQKGPAYRVNGDNAVELFCGYTQAECRSFVAGYTCHGDWGGHSALRLIDAATGEILHTYEAPERDEPEDDGFDEAAYPDHLDEDEREIIDTLIREALDRGFEVRVKGLIPFTTDYRLITENVAATDEEHLMFRRVGDDMGAGWVFLVHGNAPSELIADCTDNLLIGGLMDAIQPIIDRLDAEGK